MAKYRFEVNGRAVSVESWDPAQPLLYLLRNSLELYR
jgi:aerobic-type carbon monoxide dehydrogenase small subunit (CoxS/CutS family)